MEGGSRGTGDEAKHRYLWAYLYRMDLHGLPSYALFACRDALAWHLNTNQLGDEKQRGDRGLVLSDRK